jgi:hypothetical protein
LIKESSVLHKIPVKRCERNVGIKKSFTAPKEITDLAVIIIA